MWLLENEVAIIHQKLLASNSSGKSQTRKSKGLKEKKKQNQQLRRRETKPANNNNCCGANWTEPLSRLFYHL